MEDTKNRDGKTPSATTACRLPKAFLETLPLSLDDLLEKVPPAGTGSAMSADLSLPSLRSSGGVRLCFLISDCIACSWTARLLPVAHGDLFSWLS